MSNYPVTIEDAAEHFTFASGNPDAALEWPEIKMDVEIQWYGAEPDVGIANEYFEVVGVTGYVGGVEYQDEADFAAAIYAAIGDDVVEGVEGVMKMLEDVLEDLELEYDE